MTTIVIVAILVIAFLYFINTQRSLVNLDEMANNSLNQISVQLNSRWDVVAAMVNSTESYSKHEHDTLVEVIAQRRGNKAVTVDNLNDQQSAFGQVMGRLLAVAEQYPDLKASELYRQTMDTVKDYEEKVRISRQVYNDSVTRLNRMCRQWPSSFVASILHFGQRAYLEKDESKADYPPMFK